MKRTPDARRDVRRRDGAFLTKSHRRNFRELRDAKAADGWILVAMNDEVGRRGIWMRSEHHRVAPDQPAALHRLEICSGREGGDERVTIYAGQAITPAQLQGLYDVLDVGRWMVEDGGML